MKSNGLRKHGSPKRGRVTINEDILKQCRALVPDAWVKAQEQANELLFKAGFPRKLPAKIGEVNGCSVYVVDANEIMIGHDPDFTQGGNGYEDNELCGKKEIYLDARMVLVETGELIPITYHEAVEGSVYMKSGMNYNDAHEKVNPEEMEIRKRLVEEGVLQET
jgi:hypothetical protein